MRPLLLVIAFFACVGSSKAQNAALQNSPCAGQPRTLKEMAASFRASRLPLASQITGTWVETGFIYLDITPHRRVEHALLNCAGLRREGKLDFVLVADGYLIEPHSVGMTSARKTRMTPDHKGSVEFDVDYGADEGPETFRCRLTGRGTILCVGPYSGQEFKKMAVDKSEIWEVPPELLR